MRSNTLINEEIKPVLSQFDCDFSDATIILLGNGHINNTYKVTTPQCEFVLQRINHDVFTKPIELCENAHKINRHLTAEGTNGHYSMLVPQHLLNKHGKNVVKVEENYWRLMEFVKNSFTLESVSNLEQAAQVARAFAQFSKGLCNFPADDLYVIIKDFHDISFRMKQLKQAVAGNSKNRIKHCQSLIDLCTSQSNFINDVINMSSQLPIHVTHNDTKINNLLFSNSDNTPCAVIDLDTCMPGLLMHDFGDMVRTCCSNIAEDETGIEKMLFNIDIFRVLITSYKDEFGDKITDLEKGSLIIGARLLPFIMGVRFLTDYLNGDKYYQVNRKNHNLDRAKNQLHLYTLITNAEAELIKFAK